MCVYYCCSFLDAERLLLQSVLLQQGEEIVDEATEADLLSDLLQLHSVMLKAKIIMKSLSQEDAC